MRKEDSLNRKPTYQEVVEAVRNERILLLGLVQESVLHPPYPDLPIDRATQVKLCTIDATMRAIGNTPGDFPVASFDHRVPYRKLSAESLNWLEKYGFSPRGESTPLAGNYAWLFGHTSLIDEKSKALCLNAFVDILLVEVQLIITKQYFHRLGLYNPTPPLARLVPEYFPEVSFNSVQLGSLAEVDFTQLHGKIFLEYYAIMIRAQWDKLVRLTCTAFGIETNWDRISNGLKRLEKELGKGAELDPWCKCHLKCFLAITKARVIGQGEKPWLTEFRDSLLHQVGAHSIRVVPHEGSRETTSELWLKASDEHDWLREGTLALLVGLVTLKSPKKSIAQ